jgi:hypothetical protein
MEANMSMNVVAPVMVSPVEQGLIELAERFEHWRRNRSNAQERIPAALWDQAVALSEVLSIRRVSKTLRLSATDLKKRRQAQRKGALATTEAATPFIELTAEGRVGSSAAGGPQVELERPDGLRLRIRYGAGAAALGEVVRAFVESGRCCS